jgi:hypothetical protein
MSLYLGIDTISRIRDLRDIDLIQISVIDRLTVLKL